MTKGWITQLRETGWFVWVSSGRAEPWCAVPAPVGTTLAEAQKMPNMISATTPAKLRALIAERYGWNDHCQSCGMLARNCGHRQPERDGTRA